MFYRRIIATTLKTSALIASTYILSACQLNPLQTQVAEVEVFEQADIEKAQQQTKHCKNFVSA